MTGLLDTIHSWTHDDSQLTSLTYPRLLSIKFSGLRSR